MKIYLDNCCYGRPFDDYSVPQTKAEAEALTTIVRICKAAGIKIVGSTAVIIELEKISDSETQTRVKKYYERTIDERIFLTDADDVRAAYLHDQGIGVMDSYHLTAAELGDVDFLITTDKKFMNRVTKNNLSIVQVKNPINFFEEVLRWLQ